VAADKDEGRMVWWGWWLCRLDPMKVAGREERSKDVEVELSGGSVRGLALIEMAGRQGRGRMV